MKASRKLQQTFAGILRDPGIWIPFAVLAVLGGLSIVGPLFWPVDPLRVDVSASLEPPSLLHPMGTDGVGRDVLARFIAGAQISLVVGTVVVLIGALIGGLAGLVAGALGGKVDSVVMRLMDAILAFPPLILAMAVTVGLGVGIRTAAIGIIIPSIPWYARIIRSDVLRIRALPFIEATAAIGASQTRIIGFHILPHVFSTLIVQAAISFGYSILALASLGFVGLGAQIPTPEWGAMITDGLHYALTGRWWIGLFPGLGLLMAITAANSLADRARDLLDPRNTLSQS